ncbi:MAG TPA: GntR family transcriptional regulator [Pilimelia sp.]|nr:GntR family transcriptional regulator [Pilimelia sp.]
MDQIERHTIVDGLVERLRADVLSERYPPGAYLPPERDLAAGYGVTRTSLKHALVRLVQAGLLETRHGVGTRVRPWRRHAGPDLLPHLVSVASPDWLPDIFEARREIGVLLASRAAARATDADRARLRALLDGVRSAADADAAQLADCEVHRALADAAGNRVYALLANSLLNTYEQVRHLFAAPFREPATAANRLAPLVEAVLAGDAEAAAEAAEDYFTTTERLMLPGTARASGGA